MSETESDETKRNNAGREDEGEEDTDIQMTPVSPSVAHRNRFEEAAPASPAAAAADAVVTEFRFARRRSSSVPELRHFARIHERMRRGSRWMQLQIENYHHS